MTLSTKALPVAFLAAFALSHPATAASQSKWSAWLDGGAFVNDNDDGRGEVTLWAPLDQTADSVTFLDLRGKLFDAGELEGNIAFGYREQHDGWNLGLWAGFDLRRSTLDSTFPQFSGGVEALSQDWDLRVNGYMPLEDRNFIRSSSTSVGSGAPTILLNGNSILLQTGINSTTTAVDELAFGGVDAEVGARIPVEAFNADPKALDLRLYGGAFYFDNDDAPESISGPKARLELRFNDVIDSLPGSRLTFESAYSYDDVRGDRTEVGLRLRIPLNDGPSLATQSALDARMSEGLRRDTDVVAFTNTTSTTVNTLTTEAVKDAATGVTLNQVAYVDGATAGGITPIANTSGANTLIIAQGGNGTIDGAGQLKASQTLVGGGGALTLQGVTTGSQAQLVAPGTQPTLQLSGSNGSVLSTTSDTHIVGLNIDAASGVWGITLTDVVTLSVTNIVVEGNTVLGTGNTYGVRTFYGTSASNVLISNNTINGAGIGIAAYDVSNSQIAGNTITTDGRGIELGTYSVGGAYAGVTIDSNNVVATQSGGTVGISLGNGTGSQIAITNNTVTADSPIGLQAAGSSGTIANNSLNAANQNWAIAIVSSNNAFTGAGNVAVNPNANLCFSPFSNPQTSIKFVGGGTCP